MAGRNTNGEGKLIEWLRVEEGNEEADDERRKGNYDNRVRDQRYHHDPSLGMMDVNNYPMAGNFGMMLPRRVMTDEQILALRKQIAVYSIISKQLIEKYKATTSSLPHHVYPGTIFGGPFANPLMASSSASGHKMNGKRRWAPTPPQFQILEKIFEKENGTPGKQKVKQITVELAKHGKVTESNVYNWFQNRRARHRKKQLVKNGESEGETEPVQENEENPKEKKVNLQAHEK